jgi:hypothetical protein
MTTKYETRFIVFLLPNTINFDLLLTVEYYAAVLAMWLCGYVAMWLCYYYCTVFINS